MAAAEVAEAVAEAPVAPKRAPRSRKQAAAAVEPQPVEAATEPPAAPKRPSRSRKPAVRLLWLVIGLLVFLPLPFILGGGA